jgi:RNA polymerase sigma factor (sigma-70 family)
MNNLFLSVDWFLQKKRSQDMLRMRVILAGPALIDGGICRMEEKDWPLFFEEIEPLLERWTARYPVGAMREEAKQIARIACWRRLAYYDASRGTALSSYLFLIVRGALINWYGQERRWRERHSFLTSGEADEMSWEELISDPNSECLEEAMMWESWMVYLSEQEALCLTRHLRDGWSLQRIATELELPYERVKKWKQRALVKLRKVLYGESIR